MPADNRKVTVDFYTKATIKSQKMHGNKKLI